MNVANIVKMDKNKVYSILEDPEGVSADCASVNYLTSNGDVLLIDCNRSYFTWDSVNYYQYINSYSNFTTTPNSDSYGNFFAVSSAYPSTEVFLAFFNASNQYQGF